MRRVENKTGIRGRSDGAERTAKLFTNGGMRAIRLPAGLDFSRDVTEVIIRRESDSLVIKPKRPDWESFFNEPPLDEPFLEDRNQPLAEPAPRLRIDDDR